MGVLASVWVPGLDSDFVGVSHCGCPQLAADAIIVSSRVELCGCGWILQGPRTFLAKDSEAWWRCEAARRNIYVPRRQDALAPR